MLFFTLYNVLSFDALLCVFLVYWIFKLFLREVIELISEPQWSNRFFFNKLQPPRCKMKCKEDNFSVEMTQL